MAVKITPEYLTSISEWLYNGANEIEKDCHHANVSGDLEKTAKLLRGLSKDISGLCDLDEPIREGMFYSRLRDYKSRGYLEGISVPRGTRKYIGNVVNELINMSLDTLPTFKNMNKFV